MKQISTSILPVKHEFAKVSVNEKIDLKAICVFAATGFFMDDDTYKTNLKCLLPAHDYTLDSQGYILSKSANFNWFYEPREASFETVLEEYINLLTKIISEQTQNNKVILPLSLGLFL